MGSGSLRPVKGEGGTRDLFAFVPSALAADHEQNFDRGAVYDVPEELRRFIGQERGGLASEKFCFTLEQVEERLTSLKANRQITPVSIYMTSTREGHLWAGYLRHAAFLLAEARGELGDIPGARGRINCVSVPQPKSPEEWLALSGRNYAENADSLPPSPLDFALRLKRDCASLQEGGFGLSREDAAKRYGVSKRVVDRHFQLLSLPPKGWMEVHTGKVKMSAALAAASKKGQGTAKGPRKGVKVSAVRRACTHAGTRPAPRKGLAPDEVAQLLSYLSGAEEMGDTTPEKLREWVDWADTPSDYKPSKAKKAPPKAG